MTGATERIDPETTTVHDAMREIDGAGDVFRRFGLDTCCGGELPLATAAEHHDVELGRLLEALDGAAAGQADGDPERDAADGADDGAGSGTAA
ncbi:MAG: DUF542 domain-containing protein [Candidatus Palauibacterales bacterium]|nr:DUF542 domain-containing protein [Candidatus Palauibacterales bacterium]